MIPLPRHRVLFFLALATAVGLFPGGCAQEEEDSNSVSGEYAVVGGGYGNTATGRYSAILGGEYNLASGEDSSISAGGHNVASGGRAHVGGGRWVKGESRRIYYPNHARMLCHFSIELGLLVQISKF